MNRISLIVINLVEIVSPPRSHVSDKNFKKKKNVKKKIETVGMCGLIEYQLS